MSELVASSPLGKFFSPVKKSTLEILQNEVSSLTEERDFFKSKYTGQMNDIASLEKDLKGARNQIAKLREELITVEMERAKGMAGFGAGGGGGGNTSIRSETCPSTTGVLSSGNDSISREGEEIQEDDDGDEDGLNGERSVPQDDPRGDDKAENDDEEQQHEIDDDDHKSEDEDGDIRDHAAKMLIWANYQEVRAQSTRRISTSTDLSASSPSSSVRSPAGEHVPRTIETSSPVAVDESAQARAKRLLGLAGDDVDDVDDERSGGDSEEEEESDYGSESDEEEETEATPTKSTALDGVRKVLSPQF